MWSPECWLESSCNERFIIISVCDHLVMSINVQILFLSFFAQRHTFFCYWTGVKVENIQWNVKVKLMKMGIWWNAFIETVARITKQLTKTSFLVKHLIVNKSSSILTSVWEQRKWWWCKNTRMKMKRIRYSPISEVSETAGTILNFIQHSPYIWSDHWNDWSHEKLFHEFYS